MKRISPYVYTVLVFCVFLFYAAGSDGKTGINQTKHDLSINSLGEIRARADSGETRICIFCHTPHNASPLTPLWNRTITAKTYELYKSSTMVATLSQPAGPSRLCLSCHDGTIGLGSVLSSSTGISVTREITPDRPSYIGSLSADHPVSFSYAASRSHQGIRFELPATLNFYGAGYIECSTCHDPHDNTYGKFLVMDNKGSALCIQCHLIIGWQASSHNTSNKSLPVPLRGLDWTNWTVVADYGCEGCHKPHAAGGAEWLMRFQNEEDNCYSCHNGTVARKNIYSQFLKPSNHPVALTTGVHDPKESPVLIPTRHVECTDCHNAHTVRATPATAPGRVSGKLGEVSGMTLTRTAAIPAVFEYEICFKCHAEIFQKLSFIPRVVNNTNTQSTFDMSNASYHPVEGRGRNFNVPSIPSSFEPSLTTASIISCTDCHGDDSGGSLGPHGSYYAPILRDRYEMTMGTQEGFQNYALCYRCHDRNNILANQSFKQVSLRGGHSGHVGRAKTPCSVCHYPHGVSTVKALINFDTRYVKGPNDTDIPSPTFNDLGANAGSCTLVCHLSDGSKVIHTNKRYP